MLSSMSIYFILLYFFVYGFLGWCTEVGFAAFKTHHFVNRGFLNGPICPIYGVGVTAVITVLTPYKSDIIVLYILSVVLVTVLEGVTGWAMDKIFHNKWWLERIAHCFRLYDVVRIDHFRGFDEYYAIPYGSKTAENGCWQPGPGMDLFNTINEKLGELKIIAEDLGFLTDSVLQLLKDSGYPGMKVLQFAFDSRESGNYLPHTYPTNCVVYTGTHDNTTTRTWYHEVSKECRTYAKEYLHKPALDEDTLSWDFIAMAMGSVADLCVIPMQDYLCLDKRARINTPSTLGGNWVWRMDKDALTDELVEQMKQMTALYGR